MLFTRNLDEQVFDPCLDEELLDHCLNEEFLNNRIEQLDASAEIEESAEIYWLSMSRIMELALLCAGNYADFGQLREAGDLLVNPRHTEVHLHGVWEPVRVRRYVGMRQQFADYVPAGTDVSRWLRHNTRLVQVKGPLIPDLYARLKGADVLSESYLASLYARMQKVADTMAFVMQGQKIDPDYPLKGVIPEEQEFVEANLCRYDRKNYYQLGVDIDQLSKKEEYQSRFLKNAAVTH